MSWRPTATINNLQLRAQILAKIRAFFQKRNVLEVETPLLSRGTIPAPYVDSIKSSIKQQKDEFFLQTSPEFCMKRLLAAGHRDIYQICKAFRDGEIGTRHNPEFTILEWYRLGFTYHQLMDEVDGLLQTTLNSSKALRLSYQALFLQYLNIDPFTSTVFDLKNCASKHNIILSSELMDADKDTWLDLLLSHCIEPFLGHELKPVFIYDFPCSQAALAYIRQDDPPVAERFEVYLGGFELANGFHELTDARVQRQRFEVDLAKRALNKQELVPLDENFLSALEYGLPDCAGVALGIDRLVMQAAKAQNIDEVISFAISNA